MNPTRMPQYSARSSPVDNASMSSRGSIRLDGVSGSTHSGRHTSSSRTSIGSNAEFLCAEPGRPPMPLECGNPIMYSYYLDRGNGQFTRLIPADLLPSMAGVPPREEEHGGMVILPPLQKAHIQPMKTGHDYTLPKSSPLPDNLQHQIDSIVATSPKSTRKHKVYCDKWIHEGVCAFTQQGCKFKHEMPQDEAVQRGLGLFHGFPAWWRKRAEEQNAMHRGLDTTATAPPPSLATADLRRVQQGPAAYEQRSPLSRDAVPALAQANQNRVHGSWRSSGSQWMQNGIVPFVRPPRRGY